MCSADPPAGHAGTRFSSSAWSQKQKRKPGLFGRKMKPPAGFDIWLCPGHGGNGGGHMGFERLLDHPMDLDFVLCLDDDCPPGIEPEHSEAMTMDTA